MTYSEFFELKTVKVLAKNGAQMPQFYDSLIKDENLTDIQIFRRLETYAATFIKFINPYHRGLDSAEKRGSGEMLAIRKADRYLADGLAIHFECETRKGR
jgi:putative heme iron utilization protein